MLQNEFPEVMAKIKRKLEHYVKMTEKRTRAAPGSYWYRFFEPDDPGISGTAQTWSSTFTASTVEHMLAQSSQITVPTANALVYVGWYCDFEPGTGGYLEVNKQNVTKSLIPARLVYNAKNPKHVYLDLDHVVFGEENELVDFRTYQDHVSGNDQIGLCFPLLFRIASRSALNLELPK